MNGVSAYITLMEAAGFPGCDTVEELVDLIESVDDDFSFIDEVQFKDPNVAAKVYGEIKNRAASRADTLEHHGLNPSPAHTRAMKSMFTAHDRMMDAQKKIPAYNKQQEQNKRMAGAKGALANLRATQHSDWKNK